MASLASAEVEKPAEDAPAKGIYHFLDVGAAKYGECTLVEFGSTRILIDGAHQQDFRGQQGYPSVPEQLRTIFGSEPPHDITVLIVTHCHADHIGCLPELVAKNIIRPKFALLTDPKLGFGRTADEDAALIDAADPANQLAAVLREEDASDLDDEELAAFIDTVANVEQRYARFIDDLRQRGVDITLYRGRPLKAALAAALAPAKVALLGPSKAQLLLCAEQISTTNQDARDFARSEAVDSRDAVVRAYRRFVAAESDQDSGNSRGNGMNCQSITIALGPPSARVLLAGDMQFTEPGVEGAEDEVKELREAAIQEGPYKLFKTTHHTSHNGQDAAFLGELGHPPLMVHSGGLRDESHPFPRLLKVLSQQQKLYFARTDRNGLITIKPDRAPASAIDIDRGAINNFERNIVPDLPGELTVSSRLEPESGSPQVLIGQAGSSTRGAPQIVIVNLPPGPANLSVAGVDIIVRESAQSEPASRGSASRLTHAQRPQGGGASSEGPGESDVTVAPGRSVAKLLFLTDSAALSANVGHSEANAALAAIRAAGGTLIDAAGDRLAELAKRHLTNSPTTGGVVLIGGYDVVPSRRTDALDPQLRTKLGSHIFDDHDEYFVWSDAIYGDVDGDAIAEFPVSRIPDARDPSLLFAALGAKALQPSERFGVRNVVRRFAGDVWQQVPGAGDLNVSEAFLSSDIDPDGLKAACHYFMLHGAEEDGTEFAGEYMAGGYPVAFDVGRVPQRFSGLVFTGCCWGALIVDGKALTARSVPAPRLPENSIALSYLRAGALAFIGCTGSHYSGPSTDPDVNYAARLHSAFWSGLPQARFAPALALHKAKGDFVRTIVRTGHGLEPVDTARRLKNFAQFTCLGLGW